MIHGGVYPIATDFRAGVAYSMAAIKGTLTMEQLVRIWFPAAVPEDLETAQTAVNAFFRCGEPAGKQTDTQRTPDYAFGADAAAIVAAFQREYGIDLTTQRLHWWRFNALLRGLLSHSFSERVRYRVADPESIKSTELRKEYRKYKELYALGTDGEPVERPDTLEAYDDWLKRVARGETR